VSSWESALLEEADRTSLVSIGRERRLVSDDGSEAQWIDLYWVDEVVLVLITLARAHGQGLTIVYPAPAGQIGVLLAAQLLLEQLIRGNKESSVGIVTADTTLATKTWNALKIATTGERVPIAEVFPSFRASPEGDSPGGGRRLQGVIIGQRCKGWPVDHLIVDHLAGFVRVDSTQPSIEIFADPGDPEIGRAEQEGRLIWGWSKAGLANANHLEVRAEHTTPFSVASERLNTMASGVDLQLTIATHPQAEDATKRAREDLRVLRSMAPDRSDRNLERGLSAAWHHLTTLSSLPCRPSRFDRFSGLPPRAARATGTFAPELTNWSGTLTGEFAEIASILASDIDDLREALELGNPFEQSLRDVYESGTETLVITRTATAAKALLDMLGHKSSHTRAKSFIVQSIGKLHRQGTWPRALMIGEPSPWDWHRILGGIAPQVEILTMGKDSARNCAAAINSIEEARDYWGSVELRNKTWRALVDAVPPEVQELAPLDTKPIMVIEGAEYVAEPNPFEELTALFELDPLHIGGEGPISGLARQDEHGDWMAEVPAVAITTDRGQLLLEAGRPVDVRKGQQIVERRPELLEPGAILLIGRRQGRVGLLEALEERLGDSPDFFAIRFLVDHYHQLLRSRFQESGFSIESLHRALMAIGCERSKATVRSWVTEATMAPQQFADFQKLNEALELGLSPVQLQEIFAGVRRRRGFLRTAGRILAAAARGAIVVEDESKVDATTGLSIEDLREAVVEAVVVEVSHCEQPMPLTLLGRLEE